MISNPNHKKIISFYDNKYKKYGSGIESMGWGNVESQQLRFKIICEIDNLTCKSICDVGCGFGDLYVYAMANFDNIDYLGIDLNRHFINEAEKKYPDATFQVRDIIESPLEKTFDYVLCSGALTLEFPKHEEYIFLMLKQMMKMSSKGVSINFLSSYADYQLDKNFHLDPGKAIEMGKSLTKYVTVRHDYPLYEFTLYLYHKR